MSYHDPREPDPRFPGRPMHRDFADLADVVQGNDMRAEVIGPLEVLGIDADTLMYFIEQRVSRLNHSVDGRLGGVPAPLMMAVYADAMAVGKGFAELRARRGEVPS